MKGQGRVFRPKVRGKETAYWWLDYGVRGQRFREPTRTESKQEAQRLLRQRLAAREAGKLVGSPDRVQFAQLHGLVERQYGLDGRRSVWRITLAFKHLAGFFGSDRAMDITPARVDAYVEHRLEEGAAPATINRELAALRRGFRLAVQKGCSPRGPSSRFRRSITPAPGSSTRRMPRRCSPRSLRRWARSPDSSTSPVGVSLRSCRSHGDRWTLRLAWCGSMWARPRVGKGGPSPSACSPILRHCSASVGQRGTASLCSSVVVSGSRISIRRGTPLSVGLLFSM